jgi:tryptophan synthase alpha subunit
MGYINPVLSFGFERFCAECAESGVSGLILPIFLLLNLKKITSRS